MKANELMVGDYIMLYEDIYIIEEISSKGWAHIIYNDGSGCRVSLSTDYILGELTPVPLTREILEKNFPVPDFVYWEENEGSELYQIHIERCFQEFNGFLKYVHELQHALILCGINKEIEV